MAVAAPPDLIALHEELLELETATEDSMRKIRHLLAIMEDALDAEVSRAALAEGRTPLADLRARYELP